MDPLAVIAARRRRQILQLVWDRELAAGEIARHFDVSWPAISQHLTILREAGYVTQRREGTSRLYRADPAALGALRSIVEAQWQEGLDQLKELAEAEHRDHDTDPAAPTDEDQP